MKKNIIWLLLLLTTCSCIVSCNKTNDTPLNPSFTEEKTENTELNQESTTPEADKATEKTGMGGTGGLCPVHDTFYHAYPSSLVEYLGEEAFYEWYDLPKQQDETSDCPYQNSSIYDCIHYFNIPRSDLEEIYLSDPKVYYTRVWNLDLLYSEEKQVVDEYYRNIDDLKAITDKRRAFNNLKFNIYVEHESDWNEAFDETRTRMQISLPEIISAFNISRSDLENYAEESVDPGCESYDYNYDVIYNTDGSIRSGEVALFSADPEPALAADAAFCGIDDYYLE